MVEQPKNTGFLYTDQQKRKVTGGMAQYLVLELDLLNVVYVNILRKDLPGNKRSKLLGFADNVAVMIIVRDLGWTHRRLTYVATYIGDWL